MALSLGAGEGGAGGVDGARREADQQLVHQPAEAPLEAGAADDGARHTRLQDGPARRRCF
ncbi:Homeobox protein knotted-1-like 1 [Zea mays]|uniref:Homeobox protein knotted-1-like 1 n=1 Tax=Zea mays TaxID=4577 RepID=A0A1D6KYU9_MAIZE|nr:Homeobox protein knotted-1-like 1 [Zea mays]